MNEEKAIIKELTTTINELLLEDNLGNLQENMLELMEELHYHTERLKSSKISMDFGIN